MLKLYRPILLALFVLLSPSYASASKPTNTTLFEATYKGKVSGFNITMVRTLTKLAGGDYIFSSTSSNFFASFKEISTFIIERNAIKATSYIYKRSIAKRKTVESIIYDWQAMSAEYQRSNRTNSHKLHKLTKGTLDPSLYQLFLQADMYLSKPTLEYAFIKRRRIENYTFKHLPNEVITLNKKKHNALVLIREGQNKAKKTKVWILPELDYQIGKIEHTDKKGSTYHAYLSKYTSKPTQLYEFYKNARSPTRSPKSNRAQTNNITADNKP